MKTPTKPKQINRIRDIAMVNGWIPEDRVTLKVIDEDMIDVEVDYLRHMVILDPTVDDQKVERALELVKALLALKLVIEKRK